MKGPENASKRKDILGTQLRSVTNNAIAEWNHDTLVKLTAKQRHEIREAVVLSAKEITEVFDVEAEEV